MASGGRIAMAGGGALKKFIEKLFIKASNDIRQGKGKWKGLDQKQKMVQHDNLTKKVTEFQKSGKTVGLEEYFGVDPHTAFIGARDKVKRQGIISQKAEVEAQRQEQIMEEAWDEIAGGSGFSGDYKYDADILADSIAEVQGKVYADLPELERTGIYDQALKRVTQNLKAKMDFKKNLKDVEQKIELQMFDPKDRKPNASGGRVPLMYGGDPGFAFEYGGSWADWHDQHRDTMPVEQYIQTKLPKERLPFREPMIFGGSAGLKGMWKQMLKSLSKGKDKPVKRLFPTLSAREREMEKLVMGTPEQKAFREGEVRHKIEGIDILISRLRHDKKILERQAKNKALGDEGLDFLTKKLEENMSDVYGPHLGKYTDIDKDILQLENIKKNLLTKDRKLHQSGGLAYMLGEPTYSVGGSVGHAPWHKPTGQQAPQGQDESPTPQVAGGGGGRGQPNPMKAPRGLPSVAPRTMDPAFMQQQMMQKAMMGQQQGQPRMGMDVGGMTPEIPEQFLEDLKKRDYHEFLDKYRQWKENYERRKDLAPTQEVAQGGRIGLGLGSMSRRAFIKMMGGVAALPFIGKGASKMAPKVIPQVTEEVIKRGADGMPTYITDLIEVVKAKGTKDFIEGFKKSDYSTVHSYKGVDVIEDGAGNIKIKSDRGGVATDSTTGKMHEGIAEERHMQIEKGGYVKNKEGKMVKEGDEYIEGSVRPDRDGKMKDFEDGLDEAVHLEFKKIADEAKDLLKIKKASGGLAYMLGE